MPTQVQLFVAPWTVAHQASLFSISWRLLKLMSIELIMPSNNVILCCPLLFLPSIFPSTRVFSNELAFHIRWPKYWSFSISPSNEYSGLISFGMDWLDLLAVQGTLKSLLQHYNLKASILQCSGFFMVQLSHLYMTMKNNNSETLCHTVLQINGILAVTTTLRSHLTEIKLCHWRRPLRVPWMSRRSN